MDTDSRKVEDVAWRPRLPDYATMDQVHKVLRRQLPDLSCYASEQRQNEGFRWCQAKNTSDPDEELADLREVRDAELTILQAKAVRAALKGKGTLVLVDHRSFHLGAELIRKILVEEAGFPYDTAVLWWWEDEALPGGSCQVLGELADRPTIGFTVVGAVMDYEERRDRAERESYTPRTDGITDELW